MSVIKVQERKDIGINLHPMKKIEIIVSGEHEHGNSNYPLILMVGVTRIELATPASRRRIVLHLSKRQCTAMNKI